MTVGTVRAEQYKVPQARERTHEDVPATTRWSKTTLSGTAEGKKDWEQNEKNGRSEVTLNNAQYARQAVGNAGEMGLLTVSCCSSWCAHVLWDDFPWFYVEEGAAGKKNNQVLTGTWRVNCGHKYSSDAYECVIKMLKSMAVVSLWQQCLQTAR